MDRKNKRLQEERARKLDLEMAEKFDHVPQINSNSKKLASSTGESFMERQKLYSEKKLERSKKTNKEMYSYSYTPKLNFKSVDIINEGVKQRL